ncbi:16S rRNA (guanine(966)-N(2))-methyltransferase RsmD [Candidatus Pelagibacter sp.]|uniref:16S rRNA (guanine(966)-N(2))-methyltransferase RsmD n=1 Tax=Candidatus Pelagibacter sp. TaxID=2024849 RepID=UPI003F854078
MRIISGLFKGKKILQPKDFKTRPLRDLTKESIFNIIDHSNKFKIFIKESNVLDIFAGVGSFGLECFSRGARRVIFIENYKEVLLILKKNLSGLKNIENFKIIEKNAYDQNIFLDLKENFDIIFLDPPYKDQNFSKILETIYLKKILKKNGVIILHRHVNSKDDFPKKFKILENKKYGISRIFFLTCLN